MALLPSLSPLNRRRLALFRANRRGWWSFLIFAVLFVVSMAAPMIANDRPILISYKGELLFPLLKDYSPKKFGDPLARMDYRDPLNEEEITANGWMLWPPIRYSQNTVNEQVPMPAPSRPAFLLTRDEACVKYPLKTEDPQCVFGNMNWIGTDSNGRDVLARAIYGFRVSVAFGLILTLISSIIGLWAGAVQGYFGGWTDLLFQRFIDVWSSLPVLYLLLIMGVFVLPGFWFLLFVLVLFSWTGLVGVVRAEFLRARNFEYVRAAKALGLSDGKIMFKHVMPNALVSTVTFMPFILSGSVTTLTALDYLGYGLPPGSASLGEMVKQAKSNLFAPWLGFTAFVVTTALLTLLVFIGEAVRDALDPRKTFQ
jgi:microcin C transport system permease protein